MVRHFIHGDSGLDVETTLAGVALAKLLELIDDGAVAASELDGVFQLAGVELERAVDFYSLWRQADRALSEQVRTDPSEPSQPTFYVDQCIDAGDFLARALEPAERMPTTSTFAVPGALSEPSQVMVTCLPDGKHLVAGRALTSDRWSPPWTELTP